MDRSGQVRACTTALGIALAATPAAPAGAATTTLRLDGIGPLELGMTRSAAVATGWLSHRGTGCELGGPPVPVTFRTAGPRAPDGLRGFAEFRGGRLRVLSFTRGVRTGRGIVVRRSTLAGMERRYDEAPFSARRQFVDIFGGTFVTVRRGGRQVLGGFGRGRRVGTLAIPGVPVCE